MIKQKNFVKVYIVLLVLLLLLAVFSISQGDAAISPVEILDLVWAGLWGEGQDSPEATILFAIRIPRILGAVFVGAGLAGVGAAYQGVFRNPMADPYILGISSGATLGAALSISLGSGAGFLGFGLTTLGAFSGALGATFLVYRLAFFKRKPSTTSLLLAGVAVSYFLSALVSLILVFDERNVAKIVYWTMGSLASLSYGQLAILIPVTLLGAFLLYRRWRDLDLLSSGEDMAKTIGLETSRLKTEVLIISSLIVAVCVAFTGVIGFVGLMMPHVMRLLVGPSHKRLFPFTMLAGSLFLLLSDTLARSLVDGAELPVGAVTAFFGAPYFIWLLWQRQRGSHVH